MAKRKQSNFERINLERMNRKQRRELGRRLEKSDAGLEIVHPNAAGIDVGNQSHFVAVPGDRDAQPVREFGCWTSDLEKMAQWLKACGIQTVLVQATGVYWIALKDIVEQQGIEVVVANAQHTKNLPGRKSDVQECQWLMKLHTYGLVRGSFQLAEDMQGVRAVWRLRGRHVEEASRAVQHMQKALTQMNVQLANVLSDISGKSGQAIIGAILKGERDPGKLAELCDRRVQASAAEVAESLRGNWRDEMLFELSQVRESYQFAQQQIQSCDRKLESYLGARYRHLQKQLPSKASAVKAMARYLGVLVYRLLTKGQAWVDQGAARFEQKRQVLNLASLQARAFANGYRLVPITAA